MRQSVTRYPRLQSAAECAGARCAAPLSARTAGRGEGGRARTPRHTRREDEGRQCARRHSRANSVMGDWRGRAARARARARPRGARLERR